MGEAIGDSRNCDSAEVILQTNCREITAVIIIYNSLPFHLLVLVVIQICHFTKRKLLLMI